MSAADTDEAEIDIERLEAEFAREEARLVAMARSRPPLTPEEEAASLAACAELDALEGVPEDHVVQLRIEQAFARSLFDKKTQESP